MKTVTFDDHELRAVIFAVRADLETVENDIQEFTGEDEPLLSALHKLESNEQA